MRLNPCLIAPINKICCCKSLWRSPVGSETLQKWNGIQLNSEYLILGWFFRKTGVPGEKPLGAEKSTNKLNPVNVPTNPQAGSRTRAILEGGQRSHHCAIMVPDPCLYFLKFACKTWLQLLSKSSSRHHVYQARIVMSVKVTTAHFLERFSTATSMVQLICCLEVHK